MAILKNVKVGASSHRDIEKSLGLILYPHSSACFILGKPEGWDLTWLCLPERHHLQIKQRQICVSRGSPSSNIAHMYHLSCALCCAVLSCVWLFRPHSLPGSSVQGYSPGKNTGVGCHALLQGFFPIQGSNPGLPHCRWILSHLNHQGSTRILEWAA